MGMRIIWIIMVALVCAEAGFAQSTKEYDKYLSRANYAEGYVLNKDSVRKEGLIKDGDAKGSSNARKNFINFVSKRTGKKFKLFPKDLLGYGFYDAQYISTGKRFLQVIELGKNVNLYMQVRDRSFLRTPTTSTSTVGFNLNQKTTFFFRKAGSKEYRKLETYKFKERFGAYFGDCIFLQAKIYNEELKPRDAEEIARLYNDCELVKD